MAGTRQLESYLAQLQARIAACEAKLGIAPAAGGGDDAEEDAGPTPQQIEFEAFLKDKVDPFVASSNAIGDAAAKLGDIVNRAFQENLKFIKLAGKHKKPAMPGLQELIKPFSAIAKEANDMNDRQSPFANHIKFVSEGLPALQWVIIPTMPHELVGSYMEAAEFYANKVRVEFRTKDPRHVEMCNTFKQALVALAAFVKKNYKTGLEWNPRGSDAPTGGSSESKAAEAPKKAAAAAGAGSGSGSGAGAGRPNPMGGGLSAVFSQIKSIDQSKGKTEGLRHVTKDMKSKGAPAKVPAVAPKRTSRAPVGPTGTPSTKLVQKRWLVENYGPGEPVTLSDGIDKEREVYITGCVGATIIIEGKAKAMTIDGCTNTQVVFDSLLSSCEVVNSKKVKVQAKGSCKAFAVDKTDGIVIYLSFDSRDAQIVTAKSSEMNVSFPDSAADDADWIELPIPEQFVSTIGADNKVTSSVSDLYSG